MTQDSRKPRSLIGDLGGRGPAPKDFCQSIPGRFLLLPEAYQRILFLYYAEGKSVRQIAEEDGVVYSGVRQKYLMAMKKMRRMGNVSPEEAAKIKERRRRREQEQAAIQAVAACRRGLRSELVEYGVSRRAANALLELGITTVEGLRGLKAAAFATAPQVGEINYESVRQVLARDGVSWPAFERPRDNMSSVEYAEARGLLTLMQARDLFWDADIPISAAALSVLARRGEVPSIEYHKRRLFEPTEVAACVRAHLGQACSQKGEWSSQSAPKPRRGRRPKA